MMGPNLTDEFTLHGESFDDILRVITNGVPAMQMPTWGQRLSEKRIQEVAEYVLTLKGSRPTGVKPKDTPQDILSYIIKVSTLSEGNGTISAQETSQTEVLEPELQTRINQGKRTFMVHCIECHGSGGKGGMGPNLTDEFTLHGGQVADFASTIMTGVPGKGMPRWETKLDPERIGALAEYIFSITGSKPTGKDPGSRISRLVNSEYMRPRVDSKSLKAGKRTFVVHCEQCHGLGGRGGAGPNLTDEFTLHGETFDDILRVITNGVPAMQMPTWSQMLTQQRIKEVATYVLTLNGTRPTGIEPDSQRPEGLKGLSPFR